MDMANVVTGCKKSSVIDLSGVPIEPHILKTEFFHS
jgi:hypothetical protein